MLLSDTIIPSVAAFFLRKKESGTLQLNAEHRKTAVQKGFHTAAALFPESVHVHSNAGIIFFRRAFFPDKHRAFLSYYLELPLQPGSALRMPYVR